MSYRARAVHWRNLESVTPRSACGTVRGFSREYQDEVTCRACMYILGRYVPLSRLKDHQSEQSYGRAQYGKRDPFYHPHRCAGCGRVLESTPHGLRCPLGICCA
jgi:hypothetical protein